MNVNDLYIAFESVIPKELANDIVNEFLQIRRDVASNTLGRSSPGKFVETVVQCLQHLSTGSYDLNPSVDHYLKNSESNTLSLDDGLRICVARIARSMYTLRNKRNITHKGEVDTNAADLRYLLGAAQWVMAELLRHCSGLTMSESGALVRVLQEPIDELVEDFGDHRLVLINLPIRDEILVYLQSCYPEGASLKEIQSSLDRSNKASVKNACRLMWKAKLVEGSPSYCYRLTRTGLNGARSVIASYFEKTQVSN